MLFNSISFLLFFPIVVLIYFLIPNKVKWVWLLGASYYFYMSWNLKYGLLLAAVTLVTYAVGISLQDTSDEMEEEEDLEEKEFLKKKRKNTVIAGIVLNLAALIFFKYFSFALDNINAFLGVFHVQAIDSKFDIILPIGISFYMFQALGYTIDVYRGDIKAERHLGRYALFVAFFPQLEAGPIGRAKSVLTQLKTDYCFDYDRVKNGLLLMLWGLFQKMVISNRAAILVNCVYDNHTQYEGLYLIIATLGFAIQIYCDFAGYSNMAIGAAQVIGVRLMDNFKQPYFATSIRDFWRRWHISLSSWFKDYLYIPLGGNRCSKFKKYRNVLLTFMASGIWHGANWTYIVWGGLHGMYQIIGDMLAPFKKKVIKINENNIVYKFLKMITTFCLVTFAWIFFRASSLGAAVDIIRRSFTNLNLKMLSDGSLYTIGLNKKEMIALGISILVLFIIDVMKECKIEIREKLSKQIIVIRWLVYYVGIFSCIIFGVYGGEFDANAFIYFQF